MKALFKVLALSGGMCTCMAPALAFTDPLDQPAMMSDRAAGSALYGLAASGNAQIVVVGPRGHILRSADAGKRFSQSKVPLSSDLTAVYFPTASQGWAVGHDGVILHSEDGGESWVRQLDGRQIGELASHYYAKLAGSSEALDRAKENAQTLQQSGPVRPLMDVYFEDEKTGWAVGAYNLILHTTDGGEHWLPWMERTENPDEYSLHAIRKVGDQVYIVGELGLLMRLDRDQQRFVKLESPYPGSFFGLTGREGLLVIFGLRGNAFISRDDGSSWVKLDTGGSESINAGTVLADGRVVLATAGGSLLVSSADGSRIVSKSSAGRAPVYGVTSASTGLVAIGPDGVRIVAQP
ncbi:WD40/YVTN/BNR-like repeat-containing protein [Pseudomonas sp. TYF_14]|uniref:WD40/YVTN/BNR-like repeat-containing protein n=1 Tax=Pseudomonas sp. TYF_14 TaxID=3367193 RepID=UPI00370A1DE4